jgi:hypothetical protein
VGPSNGSKRKGLTVHQRDFMQSLQVAIETTGGPVSVCQIRNFFKKSDSRIRSHIRLLLINGWLKCVGQTRRKKYVPSILWLQVAGVEFDSVYVGGKCEKNNCDNDAEDYFAGRYLCRDCIVGHDEESDMIELRERYLEEIGLHSSAGCLLEHSIVCDDG